MTYINYCILCGQEFETSRPLKQVCNECKEKKKVIVDTCIYCGRSFIVESHGHIFCSDKCADKMEIKDFDSHLIKKNGEPDFEAEEVAVKQEKFRLGLK